MGHYSHELEQQMYHLACLAENLHFLRNFASFRFASQTLAGSRSIRFWTLAESRLCGIESLGSDIQGGTIQGVKVEVGKAHLVGGLLPGAAPFHSPVSTKYINTVQTFG